MTENNINEKKDDNKNIIFPDIKSKPNIHELKENINPREETNLSKIITASNETDLPLSYKINETESSKGNKDINSKDIEKVKLVDENIIKTNNINILENKLYFTEMDYQGYPNKKTTEKSSNTKLYSIEVIPEYPYKNKVVSSNKDLIIHENKKDSKCKLEPEIELKKKIKNKYNFIPLKHKIKEVEDQIKKQNEYDYQKVLKEFEFNYEQQLKKKEREKIINEKNEKFKNKLKQMEEIRNNLSNEKWMKIIARQKRQNNRNKKSDKTFDFSTYEKTKKNKHLKKSQSTIDINYSENNSLPILQKLSRLEYVKLKKKQIEDEFCDQTLKRIQENDEIHTRNHIEYLKSVNNRIIEQGKIYRQRSHKCFLKIQMEDDELKENRIKKEIIKSYNIKRLIEKERNDRQLKLDKLLMNKYNVKENQKTIEKEIEEKFINYQKKLTEQNKIIGKKYIDLNHIQIDRIKKQFIFNNLQKQNMKKLDQEKIDYHNDLVMKHENFVTMFQDLLKDEEIIRDRIIKKNINEQIKKNKEFENLTKFRAKMKNENIYNFREDIVKKMFDKKRMEEQKRKEEENEIFKI